jgi:predicted oxidoreductase (fatty acid repression mutant protein)
LKIVETYRALTLIELLQSRRSARRLRPGRFSNELIEDLRRAASYVPSSYNAQPWQVIVLRERNDALWDLVSRTIRDRLAGERRKRYLDRVAGLQPGGMTLLVFEDRLSSAPQNGLSAEAARDQTAQALGMLQLAMWLCLTSHGLSTAPQHWQEFVEDAVCEFAGLDGGRFRLVSFMPVGTAEGEPSHRKAATERLMLEYGVE